MIVRSILLFIVALCAASVSAQTISNAHYGAPTTRYAHGVLGDAIEYGALVLVVDGTEITIVLPEHRVFEDIAPRVVDLDQDGKPEVIVVESDQTKGAQLAIYGPSGKITATPFIGRANRWLAPIGAADLNEDGLIEVAYIEKPHLSKTLRVWQYTDEQLIEIASATGLTNHRIGDDFIVSGIRNCVADKAMITVSADWRFIVATRFVGETLTFETLAPYTGPNDLDPFLAC